MSRRGRKDCPNCHKEIGARSYLCDKCGFHFSSGKIRKDLLEEKTKPHEPVKYTELGRGRKRCPGCEIIIAAVTKNCPDCGFDFSTIVKKEKKKRVKPVEKVEVINPLVAEMLMIGPYEAPKMLTPREHAKRILSYGRDRARSLLSQARISKCWSHVDWNLVEMGLK